MLKAHLMFFVMAVMALVLAQPVSAAALTSVITDPEGDMFVSDELATVSRQAYQDIVRAEVSKKGGTFVLTMDVAAPIPETPELAPPGVVLLDWEWPLNVNLDTFPRGFPMAPGYPLPAEYLIQVLWDGTKFFGQLIDRTPLLTGGEAKIFPLSFQITGAELKTSVDAVMVGDPSSFRWLPHANDWSTPLGTTGFTVVDEAGPGTWPA